MQVLKLLQFVVGISLDWLDYLGINFSGTLIEVHTLSFKKMHLKMSSGKWRPCCLGLNVLMWKPFIMISWRGHTCFLHLKFVLLSAWISCWISSRVVGNLWSHHPCMKSLQCKSHVVTHMIKWFHIIFVLDQLCWYNQRTILISEKLCHLCRQIKALYHFMYIYVYIYIYCHIILRRLLHNMYVQKNGGIKVK